MPVSNSDDTLDLDLGVGWDACEACGENKPDVLRVGTLTDRRTLCKACRRENRRQE